MNRRVTNAGIPLLALVPLLALDGRASTPTGYVQENGAWVATYTDSGDASSSSSIGYNGGKVIGNVILQPVFLDHRAGADDQAPAHLSGSGLHLARRGRSPR